MRSEVDCGAVSAVPMTASDHAPEADGDAPVAARVGPHKCSLGPALVVYARLCDLMGQAAQEVADPQPRDTIGL